MSQAGGATTSSSFRQDFSVGEIAVTTVASAGYRARSGLMTIYHYPAQPSSLSASSGPVAGALYLQWVAPGSDGAAPGTRAGAYHLRLSSAPGESPALAETFFTLAPGAPTPAPGVMGIQQSVVVTGLLGGTSYYLALRALEADGTPGPISAGATIYASIAQPAALPPAMAAVTISSFTIRWSSGSPSFGYNPGGSLYRLELSTDSGFSSLSLSTETSSLSATASGLDANTAYFARVAAFGTAAATDKTVLGSTWTLATNVLQARVLCGSVADSRRVSWGALPASPAKASAAGYRLEASTAADFSGDIVSSTTANVALSTLSVSGLTPGVTYYFRVATLNGAGATNPTAAQAAPAVVVAGFGAHTGFKRARLDWEQLSLTAAACAPPGGYTYELYRSSVVPLAFELVAVTTDPLHLDLAVKAGTTYYYRLAVSSDAGFQVQDSSTVPLFVQSAAPLIPAGIQVTAHESSATITWLPVFHFENQVAFDTPALPEDLDAYQILRATAPVGAPWTYVATVSSMSRTFDDPLGGPGHYYQLTASNVTAYSPTSLVRQASGPGFVPLPDGQSYLLVPPRAMDALKGSAVDTESAYTIAASSRPEDIGGNVVSSMELTALSGRRLPADLGALPEMLTLRARFNRSGGLVTPSGASALAAPGAVRPTPENLSVYWHNGSKWVQMFGKIDSVDGSVTVETKYLGRYQLRTVERLGGVSFDNAGVSNRLITPNGDGDNDTVVFTFDNPRDSQVRGRIFDRRGMVVADNLAPGPVANSLVWDGKANGRVVDSSVYIYQLEGEGKKFTGTVVIVR